VKQEDPACVVPVKQDSGVPVHVRPEAGTNTLAQIHPCLASIGRDKESAALFTQIPGKSSQIDLLRVHGMYRREDRPAVVELGPVFSGVRTGA
jgi:hypothetical protein